tara:strand:- start:1208 stop:2761 length:1554 start_codon:yes stop_codon:yes gene_type:complete
MANYGKGKKQTPNYVGGMAAKDVQKHFNKTLIMQKKLIEVMEMREKAAIAATKAEKALETANAKAAKQSVNTLEKISNLLNAKTDNAGLNKAMEFINKFGYAAVPFYFKIKNGIDVTVVSLNSFWKALTGAKGGSLNKFGSAMKLVTGHFDKAKHASRAFLNQKAGGGFGRNAFKDKNNKFATPPKIRELFGSKKIGAAKDKVVAFAKLSSFEKKQLVYAKAAAVRDNIKAKAAKFQNATAKLSKAYLVSGLATFIVLGQGIIILILAVIGLWLLWKASGLNWGNIKKIAKAMWESVSFFGGIIWDGLSLIGEGIYEVFQSFKKGGSIWDLLGGVWKIIKGVFVVLLGILGMLVVTALVFLGGLLLTVLRKMEAWAGKTYQKIYKSISTLIMVLGAILLIVGLFTALPFVIGGVIIAGIGLLLKSFSPFADGGVTGSGLSIVGERGPELVNLPAGSRVHSNADSRKMVSSGGGGNNITVNVQGRIGASDSELRQIAEKVGRIINKEINRTTSSGTTR